MSVAISNLREALEFVTVSGGDADVTFSNELLCLRVVIGGERYKGTVPAELARAIWEFQEALYKSAAFVLHGDNDARKLTAEQKLKLELVFSVKEGSTDMESTINGLVDVVKGALSDMDPKLRAKVLVAIVVIVAGGALGWKMLDQNAEVKKAEIAAQLEVGKEVEQTKRLTLFKEFASQNLAVSKFEEAATVGGRAIVRSVQDADAVAIGATKFDKDEVKEVNRRAARVRSASSTVTAKFRIYAAESRLDASTRYVLAGSTLEEFPVVVNHEDFSAADLERLWIAARDRKEIELNVAVTQRKNKVISANLMKVI